MNKMFRIQFQEVVIKTGYVKAETIEDAKLLAYNGEFDELWEDESLDFRVLDIEEEFE